MWLWVALSGWLVALWAGWLFARASGRLDVARLDADGWRAGFDRLARELARERSWVRLADATVGQLDARRAHLQGLPGAVPPAVRRFGSWDDPGHDVVGDLRAAGAAFGVRPAGVYDQEQVYEMGDPNAVLAPTFLEAAAEMRERVCCGECGRPAGMSHLGSCSLSLMHGGPGIVGTPVMERDSVPGFDADDAVIKPAAGVPGVAAAADGLADGPSGHRHLHFWLWRPDGEYRCDCGDVLDDDRFGGGR